MAKCHKSGKMRDVPRYSREDYADAVQKLLALRDDLWEDGSIGLIARGTLSATAAILSEAANRAPTHAELVAAAEWARGERDELRQRRDDANEMFRHRGRGRR